MGQLSRGRSIKHSDRVLLSSVTSLEPDDNHRLMMSFQYKRRRSGRRATIIMLNPSAATVDMADTTVRRVEGVTHQLFRQISEVHIFNLFTVRGKNPSELNGLLQKNGREALIHPRADDLLRTSLKDSHLAIVAWGGPCGVQKDLYVDRLKNMHEILGLARKVVRVSGGHYSPEAPYPLHGRLWSYRMQAFPYDMP